MEERLKALEERYEELGREMAQPEVATNPDRVMELAREHSSLQAPVEMYQELQELNRSLAETQQMLLDETHDAEFETFIQTEIDSIESKRAQLRQELERVLVPEDPNDQKDVILEIRGAAGGEEAALFARDLFRLYTRYAERHRWRIEILSLNETGTGGMKEVVARVSGKGAYSRLKFESGVHRVQRVPVTESSGRIHTSTVTVIVLPEIDDVAIDIRPEDLRIDVFRSSGHGGQSVNTTDSAVRITHIPTGIVATSQNERSQIQNRASAMAVLRARIFDSEMQRRQNEQGEVRRSQVQTGDRSEKIRTYNIPQDRVTDHRIGATLHNLPGIMDGDLDPLIDALSESEHANKLGDLELAS